MVDIGNTPALAVSSRLWYYDIFLCDDAVHSMLA